jgi:hypothetical protein
MPGLSAPLPGSEGPVGMPGTPADPEGRTAALSGAAGDGLAKLLAFRYGVPLVEGEGGWARLTSEQQGYWEADADMVHGLGWRAP